MNGIIATIGDPASVGPEVALQAIAAFLKSEQLPVCLIGSRSSLLSVNSNLLSKLEQEPQFELIDLEPDAYFEIGRRSAESGRRALQDLDHAIQKTLASGAALVTGPVDKELCARVEASFRGQTGYLQDKTKSKSVTMMLAGEKIKVALVTTHIPLREVASSLSEDKIYKCIKNTLQFLEQTLQRPDKRKIRLSICALNPHASDNGLIGNEEAEVIEPALTKARSAFANIAEIDGPLAADTAFCSYRDRDAYICMYHDQALIPLKLLDFQNSINISLGLPFFRCSVDHGTAFGIAGKNIANSSSYLLALHTARSILHSSKSSFM